MAANASDAITFPDGFHWGSSTAAYQVEGAVNEDGRSPSIWDTFAHTPGMTKHGDHGDIACDHYHRLDADLDLVKEIGFGVYRFSISWSRVKPTPDGGTNTRGLDHYERVVDGLLARGISPMLTLYHWDLPQWVQDTGGWGSREVVDHFGEFVQAVVERIGDRVPRFVTINEPYCVSYIGHYEGRHAPGLRDEALAVRTAHHVLLAHATAVERVRSLAPGADVGITLNLSDVLPGSADPADLAAAARVDLVENRMFLSPLLRGEYPPDATEFYSGVTDFGFVADGDLAAISARTDFLGVNYYEQHRVAAGDPGGKNDNVRGARKLSVAPPVTAGGVGIRPDGLRSVLTRVHREWTRQPLWITESGLALHDYLTPDGQVHDPERIDYLTGHFAAAAAAIADGVPLQGYIVWSLMDNFEWAEGYGWRFGLIYNDYATQTRRLKDSARWMKEVMRINALPARR